jgi:predicted kinase
VAGVGSTSTGLVVLRGNSGSGKSTISRKLQDHHVRELAVVSQDVLRREILGVGDVRGNPAVGLIDLVARFALNRGMHVVLEGILRSDIYEPMLRSLAADHLGTTGFFRFDLPFDETLRRHNMKGRMDFGERELEQWWHDDDALQGCGEQVIGAAQDPDTIVDLITTTMRW